MIYPWHEQAWRSIRQLVIDQPNIPHALLIHGARGIGKTSFAFSLAQALLCEARQAEGHACNTCQACHWFTQHNHPDCLIARPSALEHADTANEHDLNEAKEDKADKKTSQEILLKQVKTLIASINIASHRGSYKVAIIYPAEALNIYAANALLKTLEEPPPNTIFILISHQPDRVLPTILSRCQRLALPAPKHDIAERWLVSQQIDEPTKRLKQTGGSPLAALDLAQSPTLLESHKLLLAALSKGLHLDWLTLAERLSKENLEYILFDLQRWSYDLLSMRLTQQARYFPHYTDTLSTLAQQLGLLKLFKFLSTVQNYQRHVTHPLNQKLLLENCLLDYQQLFKTTTL